jgi:hypothetical protein
VNWLDCVNGRWTTWSIVTMQRKWIVCGWWLGLTKVQSAIFHDIQWRKGKCKCGHDCKCSSRVGGHMCVVRSVWSPHDWHCSMHGELDGLFCWTRGEDGCLCSWTENPTNLDIKLSLGITWTSSTKTKSLQGKTHTLLIQISRGD